MKLNSMNTNDDIGTTNHTTKILFHLISNSTNDELTLINTTIKTLQANEKLGTTVLDKIETKIKSRV